MENKLTKESDRLLAVLYHVYVARRKEGSGKGPAKEFDSFYLASLPEISAMDDSDLTACINELARNGYATTNINGDCTLTDAAIAEMEDRFKDNLKEIATYIMGLGSLL